MVQDDEEHLRALKFVTDGRGPASEAVYLVGSCPELGEWDREKALALKWDKVQKKWSCTTDVSAPSDTEYKYVFEDTDSGVSEWRPHRGNLKLEGRPTTVDGALVVNDTTMRVKFLVVGTDPQAEAVHITGSLPELGRWKATQGVALERRKGKWEASVSIAGGATFDYKVVQRLPGGRLDWERDPNRLGDLSLFPELHEGSRLIWNCFNRAAVRLVIYQKLAEGETMCVVGGHPGLSSWNWSDPTPMVLGPPRTLLTGEGATGRCWETTMAVDPAEESFSVPYRYIARASNGSYTVENEPNRTRDFPSWGDSRMVNGVVEFFDANFVAGLNYDLVPVDGLPHIYIGSYVQSAKDVDALQELGVQAVVSLQTADDIERRKVDLEGIRAIYKDRGMEFVHFPIVDNNPASFIERGREAARLLNDLMNKRLNTYIHCTAGMGRAPSTVITFLTLYKGRTPEDAYETVVTHRTVASPSIDTIRGAVANDR